MTAKLKTAVLGATGYSGLELTRLLARHSRTEEPMLLRRSVETEPAGNGNSPLQPFRPFSWSALQDQGVELLFLATPHDVSRELVPEAIKRGMRVVDLSGAWRLKQEGVALCVKADKRGVQILRIEF
jgi:N-acetyl-gamma-glutamyl-phosphate reductase